MLQQMQHVFLDTDIADTMTKALGKVHLQKLRRLMGDQENPTNASWGRVLQY